MQDFIIQLLTAHPSLAVLMTIVTVLRTVFKPIMAVIESGVKASGNARALAVLNSLEASKVYKAVCFVVDYLTSIKLPVVQASVTNPTATPTT